MICGLDSTGPRTQFLEKKEFSLTSWIPSPRFLVFHFLAYWERALGISHLTTESVKNAISPALFLFGWTNHSLKEAYRSFCIRAISRANSNGESNEWNMNRKSKKKKRKENSALCIPIILTISKNRSYTKYPYTKYPSTKYPYKKYHLRSIIAVEQACPHRLVVQDISLSRRQRGFDFPWG